MNHTDSKDHTGGAVYGYDSDGDQEKQCLDAKQTVAAEEENAVAVKTLLDKLADQSMKMSHPQTVGLGENDQKEETRLDLDRMKGAADGQDRPKDDEDFDDEEEDEEDDFVITIGDLNPKHVKESLRFKALVFNHSKSRIFPATGTRPRFPSRTTIFKPNSWLDINNVGRYNGVPIFDLNLDKLAGKPWRKPGANLKDYFNYGFNEDSWKVYADRQSKLRALNAAKVFEIDAVIDEALPSITIPPSKSLQQPIPIVQPKLVRPPLINMPPSAFPSPPVYPNKPDYSPFSPDFSRSNNYGPAHGMSAMSMFPTPMDPRNQTFSPGGYTDFQSSPIFGDPKQRPNRINMPAKMPQQQHFYNFTNEHNFGGDFNDQDKQYQINYPNFRESVSSHRSRGSKNDYDHIKYNISKDQEDREWEKGQRKRDRDEKFKDKKYYTDLRNKNYDRNRKDKPKNYRDRSRDGGRDRKSRSNDHKRQHTVSKTDYHQNQNRDRPSEGSNQKEAQSHRKRYHDQRSDSKEQLPSKRTKNHEQSKTLTSVVVSRPALVVHHKSERTKYSKIKEKDSHHNISKKIKTSASPDKLKEKNNKKRKHDEMKDTRSHENHEQEHKKKRTKKEDQYKGVEKNAKSKNDRKKGEHQDKRSSKK